MILFIVFSIYGVAQTAGFLGRKNNKGKNKLNDRFANQLSVISQNRNILGDSSKYSSVSVGVREYVEDPDLFEMFSGSIHARVLDYLELLKGLMVSGLSRDGKLDYISAIVIDGKRDFLLEFDNYQDLFNAKSLLSEVESKDGEKISPENAH